VNCRRAAALVVVLGVWPLGVGCSRQAPAPDVIQAGQVDVRLPPGWTVTAHGANRPPTTGAATANTAAVGALASGDTIPLAKQDPNTAFFQATGSFSSCLKTQGTKFIGAPDSKNPTSPSNDPNYIKSLSTCAASSHIVQALKGFQAAQADLTPAQIQQQNQAFLKWRDCMIGKGWTIPQPKPDAQGKLFNIGGSGSGVQLTPPPGQDIVTSPDVRDCATQVQAAASGTGNGTGGT
jgi:hypothetical protein